MGKRVLLVDADFLVTLGKATQLAFHRFTVANPLPDDAKIVGYELDATTVLSVILESKDWYGDSRERLPKPELTIHYLGCDCENCKAVTPPVSGLPRQDPGIVIRGS